MSEPSRFSGKLDTDPVRAARHAQRQARLLGLLEDFASQLPTGVTQAAPKTHGYQQKNRLTCFYASLVGVRAALAPELPFISDVEVARQAEKAGVMSPYGAETFSEYREDQANFVNSALGLNIRFIDEREDEERIETLTNGLSNDGNPLLFGVGRHWVTLDGFARSEADEQGVWIGMDPQTGWRLEQNGRGFGARKIFDTLTTTGLPLVVVEKFNEPRPRFRPTEKRFQPAPRQAGPASAGALPRFAPSPKQEN